MYAAYVVFKFLLRLKPHARPTLIASIFVLASLLTFGEVRFSIFRLFIYILIRFTRIHPSFQFWPCFLCGAPNICLIQGIRNPIIFVCCVFYDSCVSYGSCVREHICVRRGSGNVFLFISQQKERSYYSTQNYDKYYNKLNYFHHFFVID